MCWASHSDTRSKHATAAVAPAPSLCTRAAATSTHPSQRGLRFCGGARPPPPQPPRPPPPPFVVQALNPKPFNLRPRSGHFHLSHNYADSISVVGGTAFVLTGVIGECNRDGFRHSRLLKGACVRRLPCIA